MGILAGGLYWGTGAMNTEAATDAATETDTTESTGDATATPSPTASATEDTSSTATESSSESTAVDGTYDGDVVNTRYGPMQVEVVIENGAIVSATALQAPDDDRESIQINDRVIPMLNEAIVEYQTLDFGNVSRATISTDAYKQSAQSALDAAGFTG